jgi:hypothetical protein
MFIPNGISISRFLSYLILPKPKPTSSTTTANSSGPSGNAASNGETPREKEREHSSSRITGAISYSITSIGDVFRDVTARDGSKSVKFPEKLLKVLENRLENIAMGKDSVCVLSCQPNPQPTPTPDFPQSLLSFVLTASRSYSDQLLRRTMAVFYGQFKVDSFRRQMKENRKIEELILMFATHATSVLRKDPTLAADGKWNVELNNHIVQFVKLLRESLRSVSHVSPELTARLDVYAAKLAPTERPAPSDSGYDSSSTSQRDSVSSSPGPGPSLSVIDMSVVKTVAKLFQIRPDVLQPELEGLKSVCTERVRKPTLQPHTNQS